ncbi:STAS domain-containing protein [Bacillus sp. B15-48]|uniref:STAS domain-containing protein n=1 Tax=Bacillus sp. B15-48 TaxID=1548601 RepID=UPI00193FD78E|nr:STAS domain-containing protein [Bacillus sp. B15-48]MBM4761036.1 STAS domain-containing protein [Bacillus sp. B15-48]
MEKVSNYFIVHSESLAKEIVDSVIQRMNLNISAQEKARALTFYTEFMESFGESLIYCEQKIIPPSLIEWSKKNSEQVVSEGKISSIIVRYQPTRELLIDIVTKISEEFELSLTENAFMIKQINSILDISINETVLAFEHLSEERQEEAQQELAQLSAPLVPVKDGVVIVPLVGMINSHRVTYILDIVIPKIADLHLDHVIVDFSGLLKIDTETIRFLHEFESILRVMGINVISTGIRPYIAKLAVDNGFDHTEFETFITVKEALESIN